MYRMSGGKRINLQAKRVNVTPDKGTELVIPLISGTEIVVDIIIYESYIHVCMLIYACRV